MILKYAMKGIKKYRFLTLILVIQLICIFMSLYNILFYSNEVTKLSDRVNTFYIGKSVHRFFYDEEGFVESLGDRNKIMDLFKELDNSEDYIFTIANPCELLVEKFDNYDSFLYYDADFEFGIKGEGVLINSMIMNMNAINTFNLKLDEGRYFYNEEYYMEYGVMPIILGSSYNGIYEIGDIINYSNVETSEIFEAKVVGFFKEGETVPIKFDTMNALATLDIYSNYLSLDDLMIMPIGNTNVKLNNVQIVNLMYYNFFMVDKSMSQNNIEILLQDIEKKIEKTTNVHFSRKSYDKEITAELNRYEEVRNNYIFALGVSLIFSMITITIAMINLINMRRSEFGVVICCGGRIKDIRKITFAQIMILVTFSLVITCILLQLYYKFSLSTWNLNFKIVLVVLILGLIYGSIVSIIPIRRIGKFTVNELLRRDD